MIYVMIALVAVVAVIGVRLGAILLAGGAE